METKWHDMKKSIGLWFKKASLSGVRWMDTERAVLPQWLSLGHDGDRVQDPIDKGGLSPGGAAVTKRD